MDTSSELYGEPFISRRESIAWIPSAPAPFEDSDVLVLSSRSTSPEGIGATLFFLDLRLSLPLGEKSQINWGFAGIRRTLSTAPIRHQWDHSTIDSRDGGSVDEGEVIRRDGVEIETGIGLNPATGEMEAYEEIWRDELLTPRSPYIFVSLSASVEETTAVMAVLGPHALALAREPKGSDTPREFRAVRMHRQAGRQCTQPFTWDVVFSTGNSAQERELRELVGLADQACQYAQGSSVCLGSTSWVVLDAGWQGTGPSLEH